MVHLGILTLTPLLRIRQRRVHNPFQSLQSRGRHRRIRNVHTVANLQVLCLPVDCLACLLDLHKLGGILYMGPETCDCEDRFSALEGDNQGANVSRFLGHKRLCGVFAWIAGYALDGPFGLLEER